jgi:glycolate oxidase FAD binding subunit
MPNDADHALPLAQAVRAAAAARTALAICGAGTKRFYTGKIAGQPLDVTPHRGIVSYEPTELVITARAGTPLTEIEAALADKNQMLAFEPPHFGAGATLGGTIACNLSGPRRPYAGSARDFVLGTRIINGKGEILKFGGQVMKNVAGFDASRLMAGSLGTLGVILEVSLKVLPKPAQEITLTFQMNADEAIRRMNTWASQPLPLSAACHLGDTLYVRLSGTDKGVHAAHIKLGGELDRKGAAFWQELREQQLLFFAGKTPIWRLSVPSAAPLLELPGKSLLDWGGAQRWLQSTANGIDVQHVVEAAGGHALQFRNTVHPKSAHSSTVIAAHLTRELRRAFDPLSIFNTTLNLA